MSDNTDITTGNGIISKSLTNEDVRDSLFTSPSNRDAYFNERLNVIETYYEEWGLWLNSNLLVAQNTSGLSINRLVEMDGTNTVDFVEYANLKYSTTNNDRKYTLGAIIQQGKNNFVSIATNGEWYIEHGSNISAGDYIRSDIQGVNSDEGKIEGGTASASGIVGIALQSSGANPDKPNLTLVKLNFTTTV